VRIATLRPSPANGDSAPFQVETTRCPRSFADCEQDNLGSYATAPGIQEEDLDGAVHRTLL
jgi:hypothetical protein